MLNNVPIKRISFKKTLEQIPDSINRVLFKIFCVSLLLSALKLVVVAPVYYYNRVLFGTLLISLFFCATCFILVVKRPRLLKFLTHFSLALFVIYIGVIMNFSPDSLNFISLQHIFLIIMWAFYGLNRWWGVIYSSAFILFIATFLLHHDNTLHTFHLFPTTFPFYATFIIIITNFILVAIIHFYYNKVLMTSVQHQTTLNDKLNKLLDAKTNFLSTMSHELRTPLNSVIGMTNLLIDNNRDEDQAENLSNLRFSAESLLTLINDILDFNKMDSHKVELESIPFNLAHHIESVCGGLKVRASEKGLYFHLDIAPQLATTTVVGDTARLTQIIYNLVGNAIKFTEKGGINTLVKLISETDDHITVGFAIADTGIGIANSQQQVIFEPFSQASSSITRKFGGTGLGLAIVKHLISLHGSTIKLKSVPRIGSTFYFEIKYPVYQGLKHGNTPTAEKLISSKSLSGLRVLLAEDNPMSIIFMEKLLAKWNVDFEVAKNGQEAIQKLDQLTFDVILMDLHMPIMNGLEAAQYIRTMEDPIKSRIHILALTASVSDDIIASIEQWGFNDYLGKPFRPNDLHHKLEKILLSK